MTCVHPSPISGYLSWLTTGIAAEVYLIEGEQHKFGARQMESCRLRLTSRLSGSKPAPEGAFQLKTGVNNSRTRSRTGTSVTVAKELAMGVATGAGA